jgi:peptidyl-prolyl cis-trans isomerase SurA
LEIIPFANCARQFATETFMPMILRAFPICAVLAASMAGTAALPAPGQSTRTSAGNTAPVQQAPQSPYGGSVIEDIIVRVNDQIISRSDYERAQNELAQEAKQRGLTDQELEQRKKDLLRDLIDQQLLLSRGKELGINADTELIRRLDDIRKQNHLNSMEDLQKAAESQGVNYEDFKAAQRNNIITQKVISQEVGRRISISRAEVEQFYEAHKADFERQEQVRLSEILVPTTSDDAAVVEAAQKKAEDLEAKLKAGGDFAEIAKTGSSGQTAATGGDLGTYKRGQMAKVLEDQTFGLEPGQYTQPIRTKQGYVILKVTEKQAGGLAPMKDVEPQIEEQVGMSKMNPALRDYLTKLREDAYKVVRTGYVDTGASAHESVPTYSSYTPPSPKKKHVQRTRYRQTRRGGAPAAAEKETAASTPSNVPSLADVPQGSAPSSGPATAPAAAPGATATAENGTPAPAPAAQPAADTASKKKSSKSDLASMKPGKKEKIRFGQAPRETLPKGERKEQDAGAADQTTSANAGGLGADHAPAQATGTGQAAPPDAPQQQVAENEPAPDTESVNPEKRKSRYTDRLKLPKEKKSKLKTPDPFAPAPAEPEETADRQVQAAPLGLQGDTSKKQKVKPTSKTRLTDQLKQKDASQPADQGAAPSAPAAPAPSTPAPADPGTPAPKPQQ